MCLTGTHIYLWCLPWGVQQVALFTCLAEMFAMVPSCGACTYFGCSFYWRLQWFHTYSFQGFCFFAIVLILLLVAMLTRNHNPIVGMITYTTNLFFLCNDGIFNLLILPAPPTIWVSYILLFSYPCLQRTWKKLILINK